MALYGGALGLWQAVRAVLGLNAQHTPTLSDMLQPTFPVSMVGPRMFGKGTSSTFSDAGASTFITYTVPDGQIWDVVRAVSVISSGTSPVATAVYFSVRSLDGSAVSINITSQTAGLTLNGTAGRGSLLLYPGDTISAAFTHGVGGGASSITFNIGMYVYPLATGPAPVVP